MSSVHRFLSGRDRDKSKERKSHYLGRHHDRPSRPRSRASSRTPAETASGHWLPDTSSAADFYGLFYSSDKPSGQGEEAKIKSIRQRIMNIKGVVMKDPTILWALRSVMTNGDDHSTCRFLVSLSDASEGMITNYNANVRMKGAVNRQAVTCYLDATLFAMFARLDSFEAMLYNSFPDRPRNKLSFLLRLWVNLIRTGQLVTPDITALIQNAIGDCGWPEAAELQQQDASEAFVFITGKLELPLLTLKMDIYHTGKEDASGDHKFVNERLLDVAIPEDPTGRHTEITLEDCLEEYFNNRVEVKRYLERRSTLASIRHDAGASSKGSSVHVEVAELRSPSIAEAPPTPTPSARPSFKGRSQSIIQDRYIPARVPGHSSPNMTSSDMQTSPRPRTDSVRKEVVMPAWQFFSLIPWYTDNTPSSDAQVAAHFSSKRPMLGMCLKRYAFRHGRPLRLNTYVDIPVEIGLPHFIQDDEMTDEGALFGSFKLSLQAAVCHRGSSVESGHYIALVRITPNTVDTAQWMCFDDLAAERVTSIDIQTALREEMPYLLFYQILPIDGDQGSMIGGEDGYKSLMSPPSRQTSAPGSLLEWPSVEVATAFLGRDRGQVPEESNSQGLISITDSTKSDESGTGILPSQKKDSSIAAMLSRRSKEVKPESNPSRSDHPNVQKSEVGSVVHARELSPLESTSLIGAEPGCQSQLKPGDGNSRSAYQESSDIAAMQGYTFQNLVRNRSSNKLSKQGKVKAKRPERECIVM